MENVTGVLRTHKGLDSYLKTFISSLIGISMDVNFFVLDSSRYVHLLFYVHFLVRIALNYYTSMTGMVIHKEETV